LKIPWIVRYPPKIDAAGRVSDIVESIDIFPSLLDLADLPIPDGIDGRSRFPDPNDKVQTPTSRSYASVRLGPNHLVSVRDGRWKLIWDLKQDSKSLYDLDGLRESRNMAREASAKADSMTRLLTEYAGRNAERHRELHGENAPASIAIEDLPPLERQLLEQLGYIDAESAPDNRASQSAAGISGD
jgi:arylsulfatase A-like enzyme